MPKTKKAFAPSAKLSRRNCSRRPVGGVGLRDAISRASHSEAATEEPACRLRFFLGHLFRWRGCWALCFRGLRSSGLAARKLGIFGNSFQIRLDERIRMAGQLL